MIASYCPFCLMNRIAYIELRVRAASSSCELFRSCRINTNWSMVFLNSQTQSFVLKTVIC